MTVVLDTHAWLWWMSDPDRLSSTARRAINDADNVGICTISFWEVATLARLGRIELDRPVGRWVRHALLDDRVQSLELSAPIAVDAGSLHEPFPGDPADRIIYATARAAHASLITRDRRLRDYDGDRTIW